MNTPPIVSAQEWDAAWQKMLVRDLADHLDWLPDDSVDLVLFALALEYVDDRTSMLQVLRPDGALVLSRLHPTGD